MCQGCDLKALGKRKTMLPAPVMSPFKKGEPLHFFLAGGADIEKKSVPSKSEYGGPCIFFAGSSILVFDGPLQ